jgi:hypothetical protein
MRAREREREREKKRERFAKIKCFPGRVAKFWELSQPEILVGGFRISC